MKLTKSQSILNDGGKLINGKWEIDKKHRIAYRVKGQKEIASVKAKIIDVKPAGLSILITRGQNYQRKGSKKYELDGYWRLDPKNRITFEVKRNKGSTDTLTFVNGWQINNNHQVTYTYQEETLKTKRKLTRTFTFKGYWDILEKNRLTYFFRTSSQSYFRVRGAFQTRSILAKKGEIRYQYGIELEKRIKTQTLVLFGKWKYSRKLGLNFEVEYKNGQKHAIVFGGEYSFDGNHKIEANLKSREGQKLGIELVLTRDLFNKDGNAFVRLMRSQDESRVEGGIKFKW